jgi:hypothetical protein
MSMHDGDGTGGMTPELRGALDALPRERDPGRLLEERTVRALRAAGAIERPVARGWRRIPAAWLTGAVAAGFALFIGGLAMGQWVGARQARELVELDRIGDPRSAAMAVQRTGSAYVEALARLASFSDGGEAPQQVEGREVATRMLQAAADELIRIAPDDPIAAAVMAAFQRDTARPTPSQKQRVVWF